MAPVKVFQLAAGVEGLLTPAIICIEPSITVWSSDDGCMDVDDLRQERMAFSFHRPRQVLFHRLGSLLLILQTSNIRTHHGEP